MASLPAEPRRLRWLQTGQQMAAHWLFLHVPGDSWLSVPEASLANEALLRVTAQIREIRGGKVRPANPFWGAAGSGGWPLSGPRELSVQDPPCPGPPHPVNLGSGKPVPSASGAHLLSSLPMLSL